LAVGRQFGPYTLIRKLAEGGMAELFLATHRTGKTKTLCVIKMMLPSLLQKPNALKMFLGEARLATRLMHKNIIRILDLDRVDDYYFIAMEYIPGKTILEILEHSTNERGLSPMEVASVIHQCCSGLSYAHALPDSSGKSLQLVHRDISPSNLMLSFDGQVKILDFGIAQAATRQIETARGKTIGKIAYLSPEQCCGRKIDHRSDIFSLGIVFWEMLHRRALFYGPDSKSIMRSILKKEMPPFSPALQIPPALEEVNRKALAKEPSERFQSAGEMDQALLAACGCQILDEHALAERMVEIFGSYGEKQAREGTLGEKIELETLLFDDLRFDDPSCVTQKKTFNPLKTQSKKKTSWLILTLLLLMLIGIGVTVLWLEH
jgi:eukaryotic-like serine/threonine-protein kinase